MTKHFASGDVTDAGLDPAAIAAGFNLADVNDAETLKALPAGTEGLYYLEQAQGVTDSFVKQMNAIKGSPNLFGVYLADEPDPSNVSAADLKAESDWIHANMPGVKTFIVADNQGSNSNPDFHDYYTQDTTHIDLWGLDVYPFRTEGGGQGDVTEVGRTVAAAESQIGITADQIVPVFQAFGGGNYPDGDGGKWSVPTAAQEKALMAEWEKFAPNPSFDYAYSWVSQEGDSPLSANAALTQVFRDHNATSDPATPPVTSPVTPPVTSPATPPVTPSDPPPTTSGQVLQGDGGDNTLAGGTGNDTLAGRGGYDVLTGDGGANTFLLDKPARGSVAEITDFKPGIDTIALDHTGFPALTTPVQLFQGARSSDHDENLIYNASSGNLFYDRDGGGRHSPTLIAHLDGTPQLTAADIHLV